MEASAETRLSRQARAPPRAPASPSAQSSGLLADREADLAALDLGVEDLVVEGLSGVGLEEDLCPTLLDDLVLLGRNGGDGDLERTLRRAFRPCGDPEPRPLRHLRRGDDALDGLGGRVGDGEHAVLLLPDRSLAFEPSRHGRQETAACRVMDPAARLESTT